MEIVLYGGLIPCKDSQKLVPNERGGVKAVKCAGVEGEALVECWRGGIERALEMKRTAQARNTPSPAQHARPPLA